MNTVQSRKTIAEFAVGLMVCGAAHFFLIAPAQRELRTLRESADARSSATTHAANPSLSAEQLTGFSRDARRTAERVIERSAVARDETRLFAAIMSMADASGVRIDQLQPIERVQPRTLAPATGSDPAGAAPSVQAMKDVSVAYSMVLSASYAKFVDFLHRLPSGLGFTVVRSVLINPGNNGSEDTVRVQLETEHFAFDVSELEKLVSAPAVKSGVSEELR